MSGTKWAELFQALANPFEAQEVKVRTQANRQLHYITARTAMNRLDEVLGPENWWDSYTPGAESVMCALTIRLPDGQVITKVDAGGYAGMADSGDDDKSGFSDSFKRAAAKFGIARYLYRDGVPAFVRERTDPAAEAHEAPHAALSTNGDNPLGSPPRSGKGLFAAVKELEVKHSVTLIRPVNEWGKSQNFPNRMIDWDDDQVCLAWGFVASKLNELVPPIPPATRISGMKKAIYGQFKAITSASLGDPNPPPEAIKKTFERILDEVSPGESVESFNKLDDEDLLKRIHLHADEELATIQGLSI